MAFRFADFEIDPELRVLRRAGRPVHLEPKAFDLLLALVRARGDLVTGAALRAQLWDGVTVTPASLRRLVMEARRAVGDDGRAQRVIATVHGRGHCLVVPVEPSGGAGPREV